MGLLAILLHFTGTDLLFMSSPIILLLIAFLGSVIFAIAVLILPNYPKLKLTGSLLFTVPLSIFIYIIIFNWWWHILVDVE